MVTKKKNNQSEPRKIKGAEISQILQICTDVNREVTVSGLLSKNLTMTLLFIFFLLQNYSRKHYFVVFFFFFFRWVQSRANICCVLLQGSQCSITPEV